MRLQFIHIIASISGSLSFYCRIVVHCMKKTQFVNTFCSWWIPGLFLIGGYSDKVAANSLIKALCGHVFISLSKYLGMELPGCRVNMCLTFNKLPDTSAKWLCHSTLPATVYEHCCCSVSPSTTSSCGVASRFYFSCSGGHLIMIFICISLMLFGYLHSFVKCLL